MIIALASVHPVIGLVSLCVWGIRVWYCKCRRLMMVAGVIGLLFTFDVFNTKVFPPKEDYNQEFTEQIRLYPEDRKSVV